jgi:hypothetical protein
MKDKVSEATPRPWRVEPTKVYGGDVPTMSGGREVGYWRDRWKIVDSEDQVVAVLTVKERAEFIVTAVNSYDALVAALQPFAEMLSNTELQYEDGYISCSVSVANVAKARAALATNPDTEGND